jgi:uncharacterized repeat protein (TIGR01451 family)
VTVTTGCVATDAHPCSVTVITHIPPPPAGPECTPSKTAEPTGSVPVGTVITYTVSVTNSGAGPTSAEAPCIVRDVLSADSPSTTVHIVQGPTPPTGTTMTLVNGACTPSGCSELPLTITWTVPNLAPNATESFIMKIKVTGAGSVISSGTGTLGGLITNTATATTLCTSNCAITVTNPVTFSLTKTVSPTGTVPVGTTLTYAVALKNTSQNNATDAVLVDDTLTGTAGATVNDGTGGTTNSFVGPTGVTITKVGADHYQWTVPASDLAAGQSATVTFTAVITRAPGITTSCLVSAAAAGTLCLDNSATAAGITITVQNLTTASASAASGVLGISTSTPGTGSFGDLNVSVAGFLFLGGLGLILLGMMAKTPGPTRRKGR